MYPKVIGRVLAAIVLLSCAALSHAQDLTNFRMNALRTAVFADPVAGPLLAAGNSLGLRLHLNAQAVPDFIVWRTDVDIQEVMGNGMNWARVDNLTVGKARIWDWMSRLGQLNCAKANIRAGIDATWVGTAADLAVRDVVYGHCKRTANNIEKLLANGTGTTLSPAVMTYQGELSETDGTRLVFRDNGTIWTP